MLVLQANGLVERQNRTIKEKLLKILQEGHERDWPQALDGVLFAHRTAVHRSTGHTPFKLMYGREAVLPVDVHHDLESSQVHNMTLDTEFNEEYVRRVVDAMSIIRQAVFDSASSHIKQAQGTQAKNYNDRLSNVHHVKAGDNVYLRNLRRDDRKGGKITMPWLGPYTVMEVFENKTCRLRGQKGNLKKKQHLSNLKLCNLREEETLDKQVEYNCDTDVISCSRYSQSERWMTELGVNDSDMVALRENDLLNDKIINAAQKMLKRQHNISGLSETLLCQLDAFQQYTSPSVQIHFDEIRKHWITSSSTRMRLEIADSLFNGQLSESIIRQLKQCYSCLAVDNKMTAYVLPVQQQTNSVDCGCHAIATATEFLTKDGDPTAFFDIDNMRNHIHQCFETGEMVSFPKTAKRRRGRKGKVMVIEIIV